MPDRLKSGEFAAALQHPFAEWPARHIPLRIALAPHDGRSRRAIRASRNAKRPAGCYPGGAFCLVWRRRFDVFAIGRPGSDRLSRVLRRSIIGAGAFHGRVRNGIGCGRPAVTTRSANRKSEFREAGFVVNRKPDPFRSGHVVARSRSDTWAKTAPLRTKRRSAGTLAEARGCVLLAIEAKNNLNDLDPFGIDDH